MLQVFTGSIISFSGNVIGFYGNGTSFIGNVTCFMAIIRTLLSVVPVIMAMIPVLLALLPVLLTKLQVLMAILPVFVWVDQITWLNLALRFVWCRYLHGYANVSNVGFSWQAYIINALQGGSPGLVVMGGGSCSKGRGFKSWHRILDGHDIFHVDLL